MNGQRSRTDKDRTKVEELPNILDGGWQETIRFSVFKFYSIQCASQRALEELDYV